MTETLTLDDQQIKEEIDEILPFEYSITSYGADYTVDGLVKRMQERNIMVPKFQRAFVWSVSQCSRFIESLLLGLPVPGIFLSKEYGSNKLLVIDGQQRLRTLLYFYEGKFENGTEFSLRNVQKQFEGLTCKTLPPEIKRRLDDSIIHATIVKQDEPSDDNSSIYYIFERLNTGGTLLVPQEIRQCIFHGDFNDMLNELNQNSLWRSIYGRVNNRMRDQELILRFFALYYDGNNYTKPMKEFLNKFMGKNRSFAIRPKKEFEQLFNETIKTAYDVFGTDAFKYRKGVLASLFDTTMVGLARRLERGQLCDIKEAKARYTNLLTDASFLTAITDGTSDEKAVALRLFLSTKAFADLK